MMVLPDAIPSTRCYVGCEPDEYIKLINRMSSAGMLSFTTKPKVVNGLFGVAKPDGDIRLILDARPANSVFITPSAVKLPYCFLKFAHQQITTTVCSQDGSG